MRSFDHYPKLRITALTVCAAGAGIRGLAYVDPPATGLTIAIDRIVPLELWAVVWISAGLAMLVGVWHRTIARWALSLGASLWMVWSFSYTYAWLFEDQARGWVTAGAMAMIAGLMFIVAVLADTTGPPPGTPVDPGPVTRAGDTE